MTTTDFLLRLGMASIAGLCIGFERQWHHRDSGLRTNMLVATGAAIFVLLSVKYGAVTTNIDVTRIIAQVVMAGE